VGSNRSSRQYPVMCIPALSNNFESYGVLEESEKRRTEFWLFSLSKFESTFICVCWLKLLPRLKVGLSGIMGEAKFRRVTLLNICLVPGTEGTGKTSTCLFGVAMWQTHCLFYLGVCSFHKIELQLTLYHTNPTSLVHLFESPKVFWRSIAK
jgi:hypothetical protein